MHFTGHIANLWHCLNRYWKYSLPLFQVFVCCAHVWYVSLVLKMLRDVLEKSWEYVFQWGMRKNSGKIYYRDYYSTKRMWVRFGAWESAWKRYITSRPVPVLIAFGKHHLIFVPQIYACMAFILFSVPVTKLKLCCPSPQNKQDLRRKTASSQGH